MVPLSVEFVPAYPRTTVSEPLITEILTGASRDAHPTAIWSSPVAET
jgi:hypothetical protein